jgi:hypothetical protein
MEDGVEWGVVVRHKAELDKGKAARFVFSAYEGGNELKLSRFVYSGDQIQALLATKASPPCVMPSPGVKGRMEGALRYHPRPGAFESQEFFLRVEEVH